VGELYELGKCVDEFDESYFKPFFTNTELHSHMNSDSEFLVVEKEFVKAIIDRYNGCIKKYYSEMITPFFGTETNPTEFLNTVKRDRAIVDGDIVSKYTFDFTKITQDEQNSLFLILEHIRSMNSEWNCLTPYDLDNGHSVTTSWKYEYEIFELVRIYKHFDWDNNIMVWWGS
jgi:hypothetical protein